MPEVDDDGYGSGLSGWAWHELGRQAERSHQVRINAAAACAARLRGEVQVDVGGLIAENQVLWQQNQQLWQRVQELEALVRTWARNYQALDEWGDEIYATLQRLRNGQMG